MPLSGFLYIKKAVAVDASGNLYAAGYQKGIGTYAYGSGVSVQGPAIAITTRENVVLVKYKN